MIKCLFNSFIRCPPFYELFSFTPLPCIKFLLIFFLFRIFLFIRYLFQQVYSITYVFFLYFLLFLFVISHIRHLSLFICSYFLRPSLGTSSIIFFIFSRHVFHFIEFTLDHYSAISIQSFFFLLARISSVFFIQFSFKPNTTLFNRRYLLANVKNLFLQEDAFLVNLICFFSLWFKILPNLLQSSAIVSIFLYHISFFISVS